MSSKIEEYFELKDQIRTLKADLQEQVCEHTLNEQIEERKIGLKGLKEALVEDEGISTIKNKLKDLKERQDLVKEIILVEMKESGQDKIEFEGNEIIITENLKFKKV